jgi:thioredoxin 1
VYEGKLPAIIDFYADWCRPCRMVAPILDELAEDYKGKVVIYKINT